MWADIIRSFTIYRGRNLYAPLPIYYELSVKRLHGLLHRLRQNPTFLHEYDTIIREQISKGIEQIIENTEDSIDKKIHYLPHHAVIRHDRDTTKVSVVYDASAVSSGPSLNDCLYTGPKFNQKIPDYLLRFRTHRVALTADIEKAFLMISKTNMSSASCGLRMFHGNNPSFLF